jgi:uncharacterized membrane protein
MEKKKILLVLFISFISLSSIYLIGTRFTGMFIGYGTPQNAEWWNISWHYRTRLEINATEYDTTDWPIEQHINFTDLMPSGTFDINSTRVFEYSSTGTRLYEVPSQFEPDDNFNATNNAVGTLVFLMNGTTNANTNRTFYAYYDSIEDGVKENPNYPITVSYTWDAEGKIINVNNSFLKYYIDTVRGGNTSGLYHVEDMGENVIFNALDSDRTVEYLEYSNGTYNFSFDLRNNATFINGTVRLIIEQRGDEVVFGNDSQKTNEGKIIKRYYIYNKAGPQQKGTFIKIWQRLSNNASYSISRNSTPAGALAFDLNRSFTSGSIVSQDSNNTNPFSWARANSPFSNEVVGVINYNQSGTSNFFATNETGYGRIGIQLASTTINSSSYIEDSSIVYTGAGGTQAVTEFESIRDRIRNPLQITQHLPERWYVKIQTSTNETIFNRNETALIRANVSADDPYNLTKYINATLDMGTVSTSDDQTIILYDDGSHGDGSANDKVFANNFQISNTDQTGIWTINFTTYSNDSIFLNYSTYNFNVTDILNVMVNITNPIGLVNRVVLADVNARNYRNDDWISGAVINCSYNGNDVTNKTDWLNGTYSVNFTAPTQEGEFNLTCNATKNNNTGNNYKNFTTEPAKINVSIIAQPSQFTLNSITLYDNESFVTSANATDLGNGTAYASNISLELLNGWNANQTVEQCSNINKNSFCTKSFNITVPNATAPGNYYINVTANWTNPDGTLGTNKTILNITVSSNPKINTIEGNVTGTAGDGTNIRIGNFTVLSIGNDALQNVTFNCYSGTVCSDFNISFTPASISSLNMGSNYSVAVNVSVPLSYSVGNYTGIVNASAGNGNYRNITLNISLATKTNSSITLVPSNYTSRNITKFNNESFIFNATAVDTGNGSARYTNISLIVPSNLSSNSMLENCNNLTKDQSCTKTFNITILNATAPGNYYINITANWTNPDGTLGTNRTSLNVTVASNPVINVSENNITQNVSDGTNIRIGNFTVLSIGNDALQNVTFNCYSGTVCSDFNISFTPASISSLNMGSNYSVAVNVSVPLSYSVGNYTGIVNASAGNGNYRNITLNVSIPSNRTWTMSPTSCSRSETPDEGTACEVLVRNLGNDIINFTISPSTGNYTAPNVTTFYVNRLSNYTFNVTYNVTNVTQAVYNSIFIVDADQTNSNPPVMDLNVTLYPYLPPLINFTITPNMTEQNSPVVIFANVTDASNSGIKWVNISVKSPDGTVNQTNTTLVNVSGNLSQWNFTYPSSIGNTSLRGIYNVTITAIDMIGNIGNLTKNFSIYSKLTIVSSTLSSTYLQGDTGSVYHIARNASNIGISGINVTFYIKNSNNNITYTSSGQTNADGTIYPLPSFALASDSPTGNYTLFSNSTYYDELINQSILIQKNSTFTVNARTITVTGLFADIETAVAWYPNNIMRFGILVYNGEGRPTDPDDMNLTVYDPANNVYFVTNLSQMTRQSTGYYTYSYSMGVGTSVGMYLAVLNVSQSSFNTMKLKAFRVSQGGPYDVRINLFENEVHQGSYLNFELVIENKGEVSQDVFVQYSVTSGNSTYYTASEAVYTPAVANQSFTRTAYIQSNQPLGIYLLNAKVTYSSVTPTINANKSFVVITGENFTYPPAPPAPPPIYVYGPSGGFTTTYPPAPTEKIKAGISISKYNSNITLARGFTKIESVTVENIGISNLTNVSIFLIGVPTTWFNITPETYAGLGPSNSSVFLINFNVPKNTNEGVYDANFIASSGVVTDQKSTKIVVFETIEELLSEEIRKVKIDQDNIKIDTKLAEKDGKDVSNVLLVINETDNQISGAEDDLANNNTESAMDKVQNAINLIKNARDLLNSLEVIKAPAPEAFPMWVIFVIIIVIAAIVVVLVYLWKKKKIEKIRSYVISLGRLVESVKRKEVDTTKLENERDKIKRMLTALEREKNEGLISSASYEKMKKSLEEKLNEIDKKIK